MVFGKENQLFPRENKKKTKNTIFGRLCGQSLNLLGPVVEEESLALE